MNRFTVALGSNLGDPIQNLKLALKELSAFCHILEVAPCFETAPLLPLHSPPEWFRFFANTALTIETTLSAQEFLLQTQKVEQKLGRDTSHKKWSPRALDVDLLLTHPYTEINYENLNLPHPAWKDRTFVLAPLLHLTPPHNMPGDVLTLARTQKQMPPALMAALNATPDSFSQKNQTLNHTELIEQFQQLLDKNIAFIDLGAESTRPGATPLSDEEEWTRLEPLLNYWKSVRAQHPFTQLSLDTYHPATAQKALDYHVDVLNDVSHLSTPAMRELAPHFSSVILMHSLTVPADKNITWPDNLDVIQKLREWFDQKMQDLPQLSLNKIIFDPGLGFGKTSLQSLQILQRIDELNNLPVKRLIGHSRKSFMTHWTTAPAVDRDLETIGASLSLAQKNVEILRVHNIEWHQRVLRAAQALVKQ